VFFFSSILLDWWKVTFLCKFEMEFLGSCC